MSMNLAPLSVAAVAATGRRYNPTAQALHWVSALLMFIVIPLAWVMVALPKDAASRETYYMLHKSVGLTILVIVAVRLAWRAAHPAPPSPSSLAPWEHAAGRLSHWLLYLILVGMPFSGYVMSAAGGHAVTFFGLFPLPGLPHNKAVSSDAHWVHVAIGQWAVYALIVLHLLATVWHVAVRRDAVLGRMLPPTEHDSV
ncbi:cytochrome b [Lichenicoccus sp.]|uniref:cytochrome b n=1 Tax=Lichenicoccus sp. TaxID=2781899 RepID=UPI003D14720E